MSLSSGCDRNESCVIAACLPLLSEMFTLASIDGVKFVTTLSRDKSFLFSIVLQCKPALFWQLSGRRVCVCGCVCGDVFHCRLQPEPVQNRSVEDLFLRLVLINKTGTKLHHPVLSSTSWTNGSLKAPHVETWKHKHVWKRVLWKPITARKGKIKAETRSHNFEFKSSKYEIQSLNYQIESQL